MAESDVNDKPRSVFQRRVEVGYLSSCRLIYSEASMPPVVLQLRSVRDSESTSLSNNRITFIIAVNIHHMPAKVSFFAVVSHSERWVFVFF